MLTVELWTPAPDSVLIAGGPHGRLVVEAFQPDPNGLYIPCGKAPAGPAQAAAAQPQCHGPAIFS